MRTYEIWCEGYMATGEEGTAHLVGTGSGETFDDAVREFMTRKRDHGIEPLTPNCFMDQESYEKRNSNWKIWGCHLFDNEADARKSYG